MSQNRTAYVCGYAEDDGGGVYTYHVDPKSGRLEQQAMTPSPCVSFLALHPKLNTAYTVNQVDGGTVQAHRLDDSGELSKLNGRSSEGESPCFVSIDHSGQYAFVSNYSGGTVAMYPIDDDGELRPASHVVDHTELLNDANTDDSNPHSIATGPRNEYVYAPDLGLDRVAIYRLDTDDDRLHLTDQQSVPVNDGAGPRHFAFHQSDRFAYVINEQDPTVSVFEQDPDTGGLNYIQTVETVPSSSKEESYCGEVRIHPSGRFLYGSNRGHDSIVVFDIDQETGELSLVDYESTCGHWPRHFAIDPDGECLYVENRRDNTVVPFRIDSKSGRLSRIDDTVKLPEPLCMRFAGAE
jgi:6-phosphogluconolactonase